MFVEPLPLTLDCLEVVLPLKGRKVSPMTAQESKSIYTHRTIEIGNIVFTLGS